MNELATLLKDSRKFSRRNDLKLIERAYAYAAKAHAGQMRLSGDPFITHCIRVAETLASLRLDSTTIAAGLLHDVLEDTPHTKAELEQEFGEEVARLVEGVTQIGRIKFNSSEEHQAENIRKMLIAMAKDIRIILIKLADRQHNMQTLKYLPEEKIKSISTETLQIYAPLAHRLGIAKIRSELEDLSLHHLQPEVYYELAEQIAAKKAQREEEIQELCRVLQMELKKAGIKADVTGRPKHFYSIYRKMVDQRKNFEEIFDLRAIRVITGSLRECYGALGIVHTLWTPVPGRFKDYIAMPKMNMYQSLHTTVLGEKGERTEIQIRTRDMHRIAENGIAAHWLYKTRADSDERFDERLVWLRQLLEWLQDLKDPKEFMESLKLDLFSSEVYVFTPKGKVVELPAGATPIDFAYTIHTDIGNSCRAAKVNGRMVSLKYRLRQGDVVEIMTSKKQTPRRDWLDFVQTSRARTKIRHWLKVHEEGEIENEEEKEKAEPPRPQKQPDAPRKSPVREAPDIGVSGVANLLVRYAKCCNPLPGDKIIGYITRSRGLSVHREGCPNLLHDDPARLLGVHWGEKVQATYPAGIRVKGNDRPNFLADILASIRELNVNITAANAYGRKDSSAICDFVIEVNDQSQLNSIIFAIRKVEGVYSVKRSNLGGGV